MKLIFLGAPGSGKGTVAKVISKKLGIPHVSSDILRKEISSGSELGKEIKKYMDSGKLLPDEMMFPIIKKNLPKDSFILDGFPRTLKQAEFLNDFVKIDMVINLSVDNETIIKRLSGRRSCPKCKREYNMCSSKILIPKNDELCDVCNIKLMKRSDDDEKIVIERLKIYERETRPLIDFYKKKGLLKTVNGVGELEDILERTMSVLK